MRGIHLRDAEIAQQTPTRRYRVLTVVSGERQRREIAGEGCAIVEYQRHAVAGVSGRVYDLARDADFPKYSAALSERNYNVVARGDLHVVILGLGPSFHQRDRAFLYVKHQQWHARQLEFLGHSGVVDMVVGGKPVPDLVQRHIHPLELRPHHAHAARPTEVHQQARRPRADDPVVGRAIAHIDDCDWRLFGHGFLALPLSIDCNMRRNCRQFNFFCSLRKV